MTIARFFGVKRALTLLSSLPLIVACSSSNGEAATTDTLPLQPGSDTGSNETGSEHGDAGSTDSGIADPGTPDADSGAPGDPNTPTDPSTPTPPSRPVPYRGINLSSAEWGIGIFPGTDGKEYTFPTQANVDYYVSKGMNTFRIPFAWERLQPTAKGEFNAKYAASLDAIVNYAVSKGAYVIIDPHNYARYYNGVVGTSQVPNEVFADLWTRLSAKYASNSHIFFNLVNEPHDLPTEQWVGAANAAIAAIRATGANNLIMVPGNSYTGAYAWNQNFYGTPNGVALLNIVDPMNNYAFEAHQYLDGNNSGTAANCVSATIGSERLADWIKWLRDNGKKGFLGEFAGGNNATCNAAVTGMLQTMHDASDVILGYSWWAGGPWWGNYMFALDPTSSGQDKPQMSVLSPFINK